MATSSLRAFIIALSVARVGAAAEIANDSAPQPIAPQDGAAPQRAPLQDRGVKPSAEEKAPEESKVPWHDTWLIWENLITAQTIGVGQSYQSYNPTYDASLSLRPRYYFYESHKEEFFLTGRIDVSREFTNSDTTTEQGEVVVGGAPHGLGASDPTLYPAYRRRLASRGDYDTIFVGYAPILTFPLSKFSRSNGTTLGLGTEVRFYQDVPLAGSRSSAFKKLTMGLLVGYNHTFSRGPVGTNLELLRVRMGPDGKTFPGDQLTGAAFPMHEVRATARFVVEITKDFAWWTDFTYTPTWLYTVDHETPIQTLTGPAQPLPGPNPTTFVTKTAFETILYYKVLNELSLGAGYANVSSQPGPDGQWRNTFYTPGALFELELIGHLDEIYLTAAGRRSATKSLKY